MIFSTIEKEAQNECERENADRLLTALALDTATQKYNTAIKAAERQQQDTSWFDALFWTAFQLVIPLGVAWLGAGAKNLMVNSIARSQNKVPGLLAQYSVNSGKLVRISPKTIYFITSTEREIFIWRPRFRIRRRSQGLRKNG